MAITEHHFPEMTWIGSGKILIEWNILKYSQLKRWFRKFHMKNCSSLTCMVTLERNHALCMGVLIGILLMFLDSSLTSFLGNVQALITTTAILQLRSIKKGHQGSQFGKNATLFTLTLSKLHSVLQPVPKFTFPWKISKKLERNFVKTSPFTSASGTSLKNRFKSTTS